tara:strand:- start:224 stop:430 length:207 start_codon:yes stop_codon:yes gene_type:complete
MRDPITVTKEAVVVGASLLVVGSLLMLPNFSWKNHPAWPYVGTFIAGFSTHWIYEVIGANEWFCNQII